MRFHDDGSLWFASAAVAQLEGVGDDLGKTGLFRIDPDSGAITRAAILPQHSERQVLGDLVIHGDAIYTTDSLAGAVYRYDIEADEFRAIVATGALVSPQGLVVDTAGKFLYVADYTRGLHRVSLEDGKPRRLVLPEQVSDYGIDGLYRYGDELVAIQNGIRPHRVVAFTLSDDGGAILDSRVLASNLPEFDEPTLGVIRGDGLYFVANSHWNRFDRENRLPDGLAGPVVLKMTLDAGSAE
jgi:sugar lactone lactonase YvrE